MLKIYDIKPLDDPNEIKIREYSDFLRWSFKCDTSDFNGWLCTYSGYDIKKGTLEGAPVTSEHYEIWKQQIVNWINENNQRIYDGDLSGHEIEYKMLDVDEDSAYTYEKYVDGHLTKTGKGWLKDLEYKFEKEAWRKAVKEYKKANGIETESDKMKKKQDKTNQKIKDLDSSLPEKTEEIPPTLLNAISKAQSDPCEFISEIISKGVMGVTGVSTKELFNYYTKVIKNNISVETYKIANSQSAMVDMFFKPVDEKISDMTEYFAQLDTDREEYLKTHSDDVCLFKLVEEDYAINTSQQSTDSANLTGSTYTPIQATPLPSNYEVVKGSPHLAKGLTEEDYAGRKKGTLEWNKKQPNENVITNPLELWKIVSKDLGNKPYGEEADASMCRFKVNIKNKDGVIVQQKVTVHKAAAGTIKKIFADLLNTPGFKNLQTYIDSYFYRKIATKKSLSKHSFGVAIDLNPHGKGNPNYVGSKPRDIEDQTESDNTDIKMRTFNHPIVKLFKKYAFGWGGAYSDYMHFSCHTYNKKIPNHGDACFAGR